MFIRADSGFQVRLIASKNEEPAGFVRRIPRRAIEIERETAMDALREMGVC